MPLWRLFYHLVWATEQRQPLITPPKEQALYKYIDDKTTSTGCHLYAIGGTDNHIHLIVAIPPKLAISAYVKQIKGASSHYLNHYVASEEMVFEWQKEYGVFSISEKLLKTAIAYVQNQKQHHADHMVIQRFEPPFPNS
ncbi:IS200/IS605 family transposase [Leptolyngbya sp. FACHB-17]|uniref:IS200/IS605 family transposase n=1 Tax=unclassified Leptolyngbya TaxID=2650499 RepID=UPI0016803678|nr:IS200/IS605 family transposase [Leptolyngbya sp. FACHB-17]MBD2080842.1 IS200/IS605 family transposase [Leptolyngbya sp. FACHB-17]